jgi:hypothetical protein
MKKKLRDVFVRTSLTDKFKIVRLDVFCLNLYPGSYSYV